MKNRLVCSMVIFLVNFLQDRGREDHSSKVPLWISWIRYWGGGAVPGGVGVIPY